MSKNAAMPVILLIGAVLVAQMILSDLPNSRKNGSQQPSHTKANGVRVGEVKKNSSLEPLPTARLNMSPAVTAAAERIEKALATLVSVDFKDMPLFKVMNYFESEMGIGIRFDEDSMLDYGIDSEHPITRRFTGISFRSVLENILRPFELDWCIQNEMLVVTPDSMLFEYSETRIYDVTDLVRRLTKIGLEVSELKPLIDVIEITVEGPWQSIDGEGGLIQPLESDGICVLVINNNPRVHERVEAFLGRVREMRRHVVSLPQKQDRELQSILSDLPAVRDAVSLSKLKSNESEELATLGSVVAGNNQFAESLYARLAKASDGNLFVSPYSISTALTMGYAGARGETAVQMQDVLGITLEQGKLHPRVRLLQLFLTDSGRRSSHKLHIANRLWGQQEIKILDSFLDTTRENYGSEMALVDFIGNEAASRKAINDWVSEQTDSLIPTIVSPGDLTPDTRLVLTNAIYFQAAWQHKFSPDATQQVEFDTGHAKVQVSMMSQEGLFRHLDIEGTQVLELDYSSGDLSMLVLLPEKGAEKLIALEKTLSADNVGQWLDKLKSKMVNLQFPRFRFHTHYQLNDVLSEMGMDQAFIFPIADFSAINGAAHESIEDLFIEKVIHEAYIDVDEKGTRATAATVGGWGFGGSARQVEQVDFIADHPFLFLIRENKTGCILFVGRVINPKAG